MASGILGHINCLTGKVRKAVLFGKLAKSAGNSETSGF